MWPIKFVLVCSTLALTSADLPGHLHSHGHDHDDNQDGQLRSREGRQDDGEETASAIDFTGCETDEDTGLCCVIKNETYESAESHPILKCTHNEVEKCHYTYVTVFSPVQDEVCNDNFEKICQVTFKKQALEETAEHCYKPVEKECNGEGPEVCKTTYETSCTTKYVENPNAGDSDDEPKHVGQTECKRNPVEICGAGCVEVEGEEQCHEKTVTSVIDVPQETCDLNPQKICNFQTKLLPKLEPKIECSMIPQEICHLVQSDKKLVDKPLITKWCLDATAPSVGPPSSSPAIETSESIVRDETVEPARNTAKAEVQEDTPSIPEQREPEDELATYAAAPDALYTVAGRRGRQFDVASFIEDLPKRGSRFDSFGPSSNRRKDRRAFRRRNRLSRLRRRGSRSTGAVFDQPIFTGGHYSSNYHSSSSNVNNQRNGRSQPATIVYPVNGFERNQF